MEKKVDNAIILAAGFGSRFIPLTFELPKGLVKVKGKPMLERQIEQLQEAGIHDIIIVTGYLREKFAYLKEKYEGIKLIYNKDYSVKNNLSSLYHARRFLKNSYILSSDNWLSKNMFHESEDQSWYSCVYKKGKTDEWCVRCDDSGRITGVEIGGEDSWVMYGPVFFSESFSTPFKEKLYYYYHRPGTEKYMWENVFIHEIKRFPLYINKQNEEDVLEFESLEELRAFDPDFGYNTGNKQLSLISKVFNTEERNILDVTLAKAGMTNNSFTFRIGKDNYIFRNPGKGSEVLISRRNERASYQTISDLGISDRVIYIDDETGEGVKISEYYGGARNTDARNREDVEDSLTILRTVHHCGRETPHSFNINQEIKKYLDLLRGKDNVRYLFNAGMFFKMSRVMRVIKKMRVKKTLCHIDANPDNFIRLKDGTVKLIDWEYAGMCDPIIDISMYAIYSGYDKDEADQLLSLYLEREPGSAEYIRLYGYMCLGGFLWMLWTAYKQFFGIEFGEYGLKMRQYAEVYYDYTLSLVGRVKKSGSAPGQGPLRKKRVPLWKIMKQPNRKKTLM